MKAPPNTPLVLGLTGGMGCGKSTAGRMFEEFGWVRIDLDEVARDHVLRAPDVVQEAVARFGPEVLAADGTIDRKLLAAKIFTDPVALADWEALTHPKIFEHWRRRVETEGAAFYVVEVPLLVEKGLEKWFDFVVCVASSAPVQYVRLAERGISQALAEQRISKQLPLVKKIEHAHFVLSNDGAPAFLREQVSRLSDVLRSRK